MKINKKILILSSILFIFASRLLSQDIQTIKQVEAPPKYKNYFGFGAGFTNGYGLTYKFLPGKFGFQITCLPIFRDYGKEASIDLGVTLLKNIVQNSNNSFFLYFSNCYIYTSNKSGYYSSYPNYNYVSTTIKTSKWNTGLGAGFEFDTRKRIVMDIMIGYAQYNNFQSLLPTGELAVFYRFN